MPEAPSWGWIDSHPIVNVNYNDAVAYCKWLGEQYGGDWSLPTEAQWEFAARGGNKSNGYTYSGSNDLDKVAWYADNAGEKTQTVGRKKGNELGIYDMSGNVWEWCKDWYGAYSATAQTNPKAQQAATTVCCAAAAGLRIAVLPTATATTLLTAMTITVFGWCFPSKQLGFRPSF